MLLISLIAIGTVFILLVVCTLLIYTKRKTYGGTRTIPIFINTSNYHPSMLTSSSNKSELSSVAHMCKSSMDKRNILSDSNSELSHNAEQYSTFKESEKAVQSDRSLTVMIPRAKYYHPSVLPNTQQLTQHELTLSEVDSTPLSKVTQNDSKTKYKIADPPVKSSSKECGALVSAGFEVSAIVSDRLAQLNNKIIDCKKNAATTDCESSQAQQMSIESLKDLLDSRENFHRMQSWMRNIHSTEISADIRSFDETTVLPVTKSIHLCFEKRTRSNTIEEANTMAERDLGSTFLLPHTHLYKPEKLESDLSGFDSL
ncbi:PREDICTED: uncharacterized protein LOC108617796 [Drosophila arizonae]|uniref:Uncharacterized protein LOC108617796 n=1 Tax=Drosophila arizonae TaxID=7263 RepID=A0ABM1PPD0_DROAR|nr:PREDICTED: uncharacterized protein LOC108617796 [Drosophila arizonae]